MSDIGRYGRDEAVVAVRSQRARTIGLLESLEHDQWEHIVTPGWRVREVAAHLISSDEAALTGRMLKLGLKPVPVEDLEAWNEGQVRRWAGRPIPALLHGLDRWGRRITRLLSRSPAAVAERPIPSPFGKVSPAWIGMMRVYDEWIHLEDVRAALGQGRDDAPASIGPPARHLFAVIPVQTLSRIPAGSTGRVRLLIGDQDLPPFGVDMAEHVYGEDLEADTTITGDAWTSIMVASGRLAWRDAEAAGDITIDGARPPAEVFLDALRAV